MPITLEQIIEETRCWPSERIRELIGHLTKGLHSGSGPEIEAAWKNKIDRRIEEIQTGKIEGIPGEKVSAKVRKIVGLRGRGRFKNSTK